MTGLRRGVLSCNSLGGAHLPQLTLKILPQMGQYTGFPSHSYFKSFGMNQVPFLISQSPTPTQASVIADTNTISAGQPGELNPIVGIDIENLHFDTRSFTTTEVDANIATIEQIIGWIRGANPNALVGCYGIFPNYDYYKTSQYYNILRLAVGGNAGAISTVAGYKTTFVAWQTANDYLAGLASACDFIAPSFYSSSTLYVSIANDSTWEGYVKNTIIDARRYGKPIYPFMWRQWVDGGTIPDLTWQAILSVLRTYADGIFVWDTGGGAAWDSTAYWWVDVLNLTTSINKYNNLLPAPGPMPGHIEVIANPPDGIYTANGFGGVRLSANNAIAIYYSLTTTWTSITYVPPWPDRITGTRYTGAPIALSSSNIILTTAFFPDGSSVNMSFAYRLT